MSTIITAAGESLMARLQVEGKPLIIDTFIFAYIPGQDHTGPINPNTEVPEEDVVFRYAIPEEYKAFIGPNQVVYSAVLGSDIGDFSLNWQGLYCTEHDVLVAVSTFPRLEKRAANEMENQVGNNITRNFMLEFSGAREATQINVEAEVWQIDFSVRLRGIDERERLSNRDIYGRASFMAGSWKLEKAGEEYFFAPGLAYVEGIRAELDSALPLNNPQLPCSVWLDLTLEPVSSDVVTVIQPVIAGTNDILEDYDSPEPVRVRHYVQKMAEIDSEGNITDKRDNVAAEGDFLQVVGGRAEWSSPEGNEGDIMQIVGGRAKWTGSGENDGDALIISGGKAEWRPIERFELCEFYYFRHPKLRPGFMPAHGGLIENAAKLYPEAWAYLQSEDGQMLCTSEEEWQAMTQATWATLADGTEVGWDGIGGAPFYALDLETGALRLPDLRGMDASHAGRALKTLKRS